uniref:Uncharacterized protein n=1 Tax=Tanacetum cinerariifolium TaxID=118510 RepID=A0A699L486_TANCI|nr:hypothetical protein [Tanacetum cinerariifolium]
MTYNTCSRPLGLDYIRHKWAQSQQNNHKAQWIKTNPRSAGYGPGATRRTGGLQGMLPQDGEIPLNKPKSVKESSRKGQNQIKTGQKREAWRSWEMPEAVTVERGRKTKENKKRMNEKANTSKKLFKFKVKKKREWPNLQYPERSKRRD